MGEISELTKIRYFADNPQNKIIPFFEPGSVVTLVIRNYFPVKRFLKPLFSEKVDDFKEYSSEESENEESEQENEAKDEPESDDEGGYDIQFVLPKFLQKGMRLADSYFKYLLG